MGTSNVRSLHASSPNAHLNSPSRAFLLPHVIREHKLDIFNIQETGHIADPSVFFGPAMTPAIVSIGGVAQHTTATFYNPLTLDCIDNAPLQGGRATASIFRSKSNIRNIIINYNVYAPAGNTVNDREELANLLNLISNSINENKLRFPSA